MARARVPVGVSACLLGERVRWDGGHKLDPVVAGELSRLFRWVPVCPEYEAGMGAPREAVHLVGRRAPRLLGVDTGRDWTDAVRRLARERVATLAAEGVRGFVLKSRSPSCGLAAVPLHDREGRPVAEGQGLFAAELTRLLPGLPVVEEWELHDPDSRRRFVEAVRGWRPPPGPET